MGATQALGLTTLYVRARYERRVVMSAGERLHYTNPPSENEPMSLTEVAYAVTQVSRYLAFAPLVWPSYFARPSVEGRREALEDVSIVSLEMRSPLEILVALGPDYLSKAGPGLVGLAEQISTFGPRVSRIRKEELVRIEELDQRLSALRKGRAEAFGADLLSNQPTPHLQIEPTRIDFLDPTADLDDDDDLEDIQGWGQ